MKSLNEATPFFSGQSSETAFERRWNAWSTALGAVVWVGFLAGAGWGGRQWGPAECLFLLAPLVTIPLGLRLVRDAQGQGIAEPLFRLTFILQPLGAFLAVAAFALSPGRWAGALATGWLGVTACMGLCGLLEIVQSGLPLLERTCLNLGLVYLPHTRRVPSGDDNSIRSQYGRRATYKE